MKYGYKLTPNTSSHAVIDTLKHVCQSNGNNFMKICNVIFINNRWSYLLLFTLAGHVGLWSVVRLWDRFCSLSSLLCSLRAATATQRVAGGSNG